MMVVPEGGSTFMHNMTMVADGHTGIEHALPVAKFYKDVEQFWSGTKVGYTPTLIVAYGGIWGENYWYQNTKVWDDKRLLTFVPRQVVDERALRPRVTSSNGEYNHMNAAKGAARLASKGVGVQIGAHGQREGLGAHWETWMLVQGGMTPMQALHAATIGGARYLAMDKEIGSLEPGKLADLIVLDANPLENIRNTETVRYTVVNGRVFDAATMNEIGNHPRNRQKFFFEENGGNWVPSASAGSDVD
jgi:imidazolonepropionase-like amidohydrolase